MTPIPLVDQRDAEPRWPLLLALAALCRWQAALPSSLLMGGSRWIPLGSVVGLLVPAVILHRRDVHDLNQVHIGHTFARLVLEHRLLSPSP
jgi:hypothetical protein